MTQVALSRLTKAYGGHLAVRGVDLTIADGEFVSLLGPSGCGKTTTLRCIAGFETPSSGAIRFGDLDVVGLPTRSRDIGMVFQSYALFPHMTVEENLSFGLEMRKVGSAERRRRVADVLGMVQLSPFGGRYPRELSGGQQQRVALARALVIEPRVLLLDEPLANLDAKLRDEMRLFIRSLQERVGITTVYVTHDQAEAMVMSDRIVVMFDGSVHQVGAPRDVYGRPASRQVASFVGQSNFVEGRVKGAEGGLLHVVETPIGDLRAHAPHRLGAGAAATILLRPEALHLHSVEPADAAFPVRIREQHFLGNAEHYVVEGDGGTRLQIEQTGGPMAPAATQAWITISHERSWILPEPERAAA